MDNSYSLKYLKKKVYSKYKTFTEILRMSACIEEHFAHSIATAG